MTAPFYLIKIGEVYPFLWQFQMSKNPKNESSPRLLQFPYMSYPEGMDRTFSPRELGLWV